MLDKAEIRKEIARLEYEESSYPNFPVSKTDAAFDFGDRGSLGFCKRVYSSYDFFIIRHHKKISRIAN